MIIIVAIITIYKNFTNKLDTSKLDFYVKNLYILVLYDIIVNIFSSNSICKFINIGINQYHPYIS